MRANGFVNKLSHHNKHFLAHASTLFGITFQGFNDRNEPDVSGLANCKPLELELMTSVDQIVPYFNINTNLWLKQYVFKHLRFLGSKNLSQIGALIFLAVWHGYQFNYFETFLLKFAFMFVERLVRIRMYGHLVKPLIDQNENAFYVWKALTWLTATTALNYVFVLFDLLTFEKGVVAYNSVYWFGHVIAILIFIVHLALGNRGCATRDKKVVSQVSQNLHFRDNNKPLPFSF